MAISEEDIHGDIAEYRTVTLKNNKPQNFTKAIHNSQENLIGLCGIKSYEDFWNTSKSDYSLFLRDEVSLDRKKLLTKI